MPKKWPPRCPQHQQNSPPAIQSGDDYLGNAIEEGDPPSDGGDGPPSSPLGGNSLVGDPPPSSHEGSDPPDDGDAHADAEGRGNQQTSSSRKKLLTPQQEQDAVDWYRSNRVLWDLGHAEHRNRPLKNRITNEKATEFGVTPNQLVQWLKN